MIFRSAILSLAIAVTGCSYATQTTSGKSYLARYSDVGPETVAGTTRTVAGGNQGVEPFDTMIRRAAAVEPILRFPARIGLARIVDGRLSGVPAEEVEAWLRVRDELGHDFGEFVPVSPLVARMTSDSISRRRQALPYETINEIRLGAARQHLDAVLVYEVYSTTASSTNILVIADITIIGGYILPSRMIDAKGFARAMLIDVIQGYPYGTADAVVDDSASSASWGSGERRSALSTSVETQAAIALTVEVKQMFMRLRWELAENREAKE